ncbi:DHH family phosphoesterase [Priestia taiwanensis]|uniref:Cyclic-di-AMP phosphodiesterase n=1 Tax=Priestia taiwanensis TaxID=1347902 RepID=A0A917AXI5_9BACI|nr:DHH family phosphoesterase [Priestia taiwanensis]MBM7364862.1 c-di-AMP phosphodiesterase-like protein [Priestia taiwanensis]GGE83106.1 DHH family phosphoesterase [Priestia taiwanensis]
MPNFDKKHTFLSFIVVLSVLVAALLMYTMRINVWVSSIFFVMFIVFLFFFCRYMWQFRKKIDLYITNMHERIETVNTEVFTEMPIGILLFNNEYEVEWANPYFTSYFEKDTLIGSHLFDLSENLLPFIKQEAKDDIITIRNRKFKVTIRRSERLMYFFDVTEQTQIEKLYEEQRTVIAVILLDNYDEVTQGLDDQARMTMTSLVTSSLNKWALENGLFLKRAASDRYYAVLDASILAQLEQRKFGILDEVRELTGKQGVPLTLSIGIGAGDYSLPELGTLAQSSLDLALGRGGDQVAIKQMSGKVKFYGGKTNPVEKRTRVRARVISHALKDLILDSDKVLIMGHKSPDMDAIGAAIGILKIAQLNQKEGYIVIDEKDLDKGVKRLMGEIKTNSSLWQHVIRPEKALEMVKEDTLLVIVDTHKPSMVIEEKLLKKIENVIVIDHHRRGEEFIEDPLLVYMEPYASSTCELVTELLEYQPKRSKLTMLESTALLAGIIVDTKSFTFRTGARTFDAASYLRSHGADTILVQKLLKEDLESYLQRASLMEHAYFYREGIAIAKTTNSASQVLIAQAADTLLTMTGVVASFVIAKRDAGNISISSRSLGDVNVQLIMEALNGGGHLTNAATQISDISVEEAEQMLHTAIDEYFEGGRRG